MDVDWWRPYGTVISLVEKMVKAVALPRHRMWTRGLGLVDKWQSDITVPSSIKRPSCFLDHKYIIPSPTRPGNVIFMNFEPTKN